MLGMCEPAGCSPVTRALRQTGVSDGKVDTQRSPRQPTCESSPSVGATPRSIARSSRPGPSPSTTARISFFTTWRIVTPSLDGLPTKASAQDAQALVLLLRAAAHARGEHEAPERHQVADHRDQR